MPSHDTEEFGGELYHDIIARLERSWGIWLDTLSQVDEDNGQQAAQASSMMDETAHDDEAALEEIRSLLEGSTYETVAAPDDATQKADLSDERRAMEYHHERLLGAIEAASQASNEVLDAVRERIGGLTWERYEDRAARLSPSSSAQDA